MNCNLMVNTFMKHMLLAATALGVLIASLIVAFSKKEETGMKKSLFKTGNDSKFLTDDRLAHANQIQFSKQ